LIGWRRIRNIKPEHIQYKSFFVIHIAQILSVVHDAQKLILIRLLFFIYCKPRQITTNTSVIDLNTKLAEVYYNMGKPHLFRVRNDVTLSGLNDQMDQINHQLNYRDTRRVDNVKYWCPLTDLARRVQFSQMNLRNDDDVRTMFLIFGQYNTKGLIELDTSLVRYVEEIHKSLIWSINYEEIRALLEKPDE